MDDNEYYAMMRRQYSNPVKLGAKKSSVNSKKSSSELGKTAGSYSDWEKKYGHEDAEMFQERNSNS